MGETERVGINLASSCDLLRCANGGLCLRLAGDGLLLREMFGPGRDGGGSDRAGETPLLPTPDKGRRGDCGGEGSLAGEVAAQSGRPSAWNRLVTDAGCGGWPLSCLRVGLGVGGGTGGEPSSLRGSRPVAAAAMGPSPSGRVPAAEMVQGALQRGMGQYPH